MTHEPDPAHYTSPYECYYRDCPELPDSPSLIMPGAYEPADPATRDEGMLSLCLVLDAWAHVIPKIDAQSTHLLPGQQAAAQLVQVASQHKHTSAGNDKVGSYSFFGSLNCKGDNISHDCVLGLMKRLSVPGRVLQEIIRSVLQRKVTPSNARDQSSDRDEEKSPEIHHQVRDTDGYRRSASEPSVGDAQVGTAEPEITDIDHTEQQIEQLEKR